MLKKTVEKILSLPDIVAFFDFENCYVFTFYENYVLIQCKFDTEITKKLSDWDMSITANGYVSFKKKIDNINVEIVLTD